MSEHRLEVADVFRAHQQEFLQRWVMSSLANSARFCVMSAYVARPHGARIWNGAIAATMKPLLTTPAAIGIVPSASRQPATVGCCSRFPACCPYPTRTSSSPYPSNSRHSPYATSVSSIRCCFGPLPRPCWRSPLTHAISVHVSACWRCCTRGLRPCDIILTSIVWSPPADSPLTTLAGFQPSLGSSCPCVC